MSGLVKKIGLLAVNSKQMYSLLEKRVPKTLYELSVINFDENIFMDSNATVENNQALSELRDRADSMDILIAAPNLITPLLNNLKHVQWIQLIWAGVEGITRTTQHPPSFPVTRFGGVFGDHMAEYTIGNIINYERQGFKFHDKQKEKVWVCNTTVEYRMISDLTITILGCGDIGERIAKTLKHFGATVYGMVNKKRESHNDCVDEYFTPAELPTYLAKSDYVCNVLPSTPFTKNFLTSEILKHCKDTVFINIGRGDVIDEHVLLDALQKNWFRAAILDVFEQEPLPSDSKLWTTPNVHMTPHVAGVTLPRDVAECFLKQLELFENEKPLNFVIDWNRGY